MPGGGVVDGHPYLVVVANAAAVPAVGVDEIREEDRTAQLPHVFRIVGVAHALGKAVLIGNDLHNGIGAPLLAVRLLAHGGVIARGGVIGEPPLPFESILEEPAMEVDAVRLVAPI